MYELIATDELLRLLDERGVEWMPSVFDPQHETFYDVNGVGFIVTEFPEIGRMSLACDMRITPEQAIAATLGAGTCREVYLLMATDIGDGREEVLGVYATEEAAMAAISENKFGYAFHHVRKWEVDG